jgi:hypothetical protein
MVVLRARTLRRHGGLLVAGALGALATVSVSLALASVEDSTPVPSGAYEAGTLAPLASTVDPADQAAFGILRRAVSAGDAVSAAQAQAASSDSFSGMFGANVALARRANGLGALGDAWVVPGDGSICLIAEGNVGAVDDALGGAACEADAGATVGQLEMVAASEGAPGTLLVVGVVPDGVASVSLTLADGTTQTLSVNDNVYMAEVQGGASPEVDFAGPDGAVSLPPIALPTAQAPPSP